MLFSFPERVNEVAARLVAAGVATSLTIALLFGQHWILPVLALGFLLRVGFGPRFSPLARAAMSIAPRLAAPRPVAGAPKRFAQGIGALCAITASALFFTGHLTAGRSVTALVLVFATLEASIAFCAGCFMYRLLQRAGILSPDACLDCVVD